jgi:hypothetical protein
MLRKTFVVLATTLVLSTAFAADAMARGGGHGGPSGGVGAAAASGTAGGVGHGIGGMGGVGVGTGVTGGIGGVGHTSMGLASLPVTATPTASRSGNLGTACNYAGPNRPSVYPWCNP